MSNVTTVKPQKYELEIMEQEHCPDIQCLNPSEKEECKYEF